jgi:L-threonylcarbamoyladenylate synthase
MDLSNSIQALRNGKTILYPSDTIWGIGCDATDANACDKIIDIKNRPNGKSFIVLMDGFPMLERYINEFHEVCYDLVDLATHPLTIIYPNARGLAASILASDGSVGIRITKDPLCLKLIRGLRKPLLSTSANVSGSKNPETYSDIHDEIKSSVDEIVKQKLTEQMAAPSKVIKISVSGEITLIRK